MAYDIRKLKTTQAGFYEYCNLNEMVKIEATAECYLVTMIDSCTIRVALTDPTISAIITACNSAYTGD